MRKGRGVSCLRFVVPGTPLGACAFRYSGDDADAVTLGDMRYNEDRDILIRRNQTSTQPEERWRVMWRALSTVAIRSPLHPWAVALEHARAHARRTGGSVYRQIGRDAPERVEW